MKQKKHHSLYEDILAVSVASLFVSLGVYLFKLCGFLTGGTAGLALILNQVTDYSFGLIFFTINLPFYYLAWTKMGRRFTTNTFISVTLVSVVSEYLNLVIKVSSVDPIFAAIAGGFLIGSGILILFRHVSSLGGLGVLAKYVQDRFGLSAGKFQMAVDVSIVLIGFFLVPIWILGLSVLGAIAMNLVIAINHKPGRYLIT